MHSYLAAAAMIASLAVASPAVASGPVQQPIAPVDIQRLHVHDVIRATLPNIGVRWSVFCTPSHPVRMTCWARNPQARYVRRYLAAVRPGGYSLAAVPPWTLTPLKYPGPRVDGRRG